MTYCDLKVLFAADHEAASQMAADRIAATVKRNPRANLLVATGNTPIRAYELLPSFDLDWSGVKVFQLDEYVGIASGDERSLFDWMLSCFVAPLGIPNSNIARLDGCAEDLAAECARHDEAMAAAGGIDLCVLGLGPNGHLGFNEPPSLPDATSRPVRLTRESLASNAVYFSGKVPTEALTTGMAQILASREILLMATGERKRCILDKILHGPVTPDVPASQLRLAESEVSVIVDAAAMGGGA